MDDTKVTSNLYRELDNQFWGFNDKGELIVKPISVDEAYVVAIRLIFDVESWISGLQTKSTDNLVRINKTLGMV